jgi:putative restriction endonuclease
MSYWWVNHKQTFLREFQGGYIWSPHTKKGGAFNQTYDNLRHAAVGDIVFSYANASIKLIGIVEESFKDADRPFEFGQTGERWNNNGYLVKINWQKLETPFRPKAFIKEIAPLLPIKHSPIRTDGNGNEGVYLARLSEELGVLLVQLLRHSDSGILNIVADLEESVEEQRLANEIADHIEESSISETEKKQLIKARVGQGIFRQNVLMIESACRITKLTDDRLLIASHILPWSRCSTNKERLDGSNGLLLSPHVDKLFDKSLITFSNSGQVWMKDESVRHAMKKWKLEGVLNVGKFSDKQTQYLEYHRDEYFAKGGKKISV